MVNCQVSLLLFELLLHVKVFKSKVILLVLLISITILIILIRIIVFFNLFYCRKKLSYQMNICKLISLWIEIGEIALQPLYTAPHGPHVNICYLDDPV